MQAGIRLSVGVPDQLDGRLLVIFDGECVLCNRSVRWLLRRDRADRLRFAPSQSPGVFSLLARAGFSASAMPGGPGTILVVRHAGTPSERVLVRSAATVALLASLPAPWPVAAAALWCLPRPVRDVAYRLVARWRHRLGGRLETCMLPGDKESGHFL